MNWAISTRNISRVYSFNQAAKIWGDAKPWRDLHASWRPLDGRRMEHKRIVKLSDDRGYECVLFDTSLVTYLADGSVLLRCYNSQSSQNFADCVAPQGCTPLSRKSRMYWKVRTDHGDHYYRQGDTPLHLTKTAKGNWELISDPDKLTEQAFDAKKGAAVRKILKTYNTWFEISQRLGVKLNSNPYPYLGQSGRLQLDALQIAPTDPEVFIAAAPYLGAPEKARQLAYDHFGAFYQRPVPLDRLPRN